MIKNAKTLLFDLRSLVNTDEDEIWIDSNAKTFHRLHLATEPDTFIPFPSGEPSVLGLLRYLSKEGYIILDSQEEYLTLTYKAFYYESFVRDERRAFIRHSVLIPIFITLASNAVLFLIQQTGSSVLSLLMQWLRLLGR